MKIGNSCFSDCPNIIEINLEHTQCKKLGVFSFRDCYSLEEISLPETLDEIGLGSFVNTKYNI